jgi:hypothetical protein
MAAVLTLNQVVTAGNENDELLGCTREELLEQQSHLLIEECHQLQLEVSRYRRNMAKMVCLVDEMAATREAALRDLDQAQKALRSALDDETELDRCHAKLDRTEKQNDSLRYSHEKMFVELNDLRCMAAELGCPVYTEIWEKRKESLEWRGFEHFKKQYLARKKQSENSSGDS